MSFVNNVYANAKRWTIKAFRNPFVLVVSLVQPIVFLVLFTQVFGTVTGKAVPGTSYETYLVPAIAIQVSLAAAATSGIGFVNDIEEGMYEKVLASPMRQTEVFLGKTLAELFRMAVQIAIILGLGVVLGARIHTGFLGALGVIGVGVLFSVWFIAFTNTVAVLTEDQESTIITSNFIQFPLLFLSSAFLPVNTLPGWIQAIATYNPVTYGVDAARTLMLGEAQGQLVLDGFSPVLGALLPSLTVLVVLATIFGYVAVYVLRRSRNNITQ